MKKLEIRAGKEAFDLIKRNGFNRNMIRGVVAAAGGPKWFTTYGLTRYIIGSLLDNQNLPVHLLGSSVGAWQMTAGACANPSEAIDRLKDAYINYIYSDQPDSAEISAAIREILTVMLGDEVPYILSNQARILHVITSRGRGLLNGKSKISLMPGFAFTAFTNAINRGWLKWSVERRMFSNRPEMMFDETRDELPTFRHRLTAENMVEVLRASGAIPFVMEGVYHIPDAPAGGYWDGGITDYQISLPYDLEEGIILHPHFSPVVLPGWFDKKLPWVRKASDQNMSKVLLIYPTQEYINSLPQKRISEMKDFYRFGNDQVGRIKYWETISSRSLELAEDLHELIETGKIRDSILANN